MDAQKLLNVLPQFPLFAQLPTSDLRQIAQLATPKTAPKNTYLYLADEPSDYFCLLVQGAVKIGIHSPDGREIIKNIQHPYTVFGELGLIAEKTRAEFASTMTAAAVAQLTQVAGVTPGTPTVAPISSTCPSTG